MSDIEGCGNPVYPGALGRVPIGYGGGTVALPVAGEIARGGD
jgi:hypothetical protein